MTAQITVASRAKAQQPAAPVRQDFEDVEADQPGVSWTRRGLLILLGVGTILFAFFGRTDAAKVADATGEAKPETGKPDEQKSALLDGITEQTETPEIPKGATQPVGQDQTVQTTTTTTDTGTGTTVLEQSAAFQLDPTQIIQSRPTSVSNFDATFDTSPSTVPAGSRAQSIDLAPNAGGGSGSSGSGGAQSSGNDESADPTVPSDQSPILDEAARVYDIAELFEEMGEIFDPLPDISVAQISVFTVGDLVNEVALDHLFAQSDLVDSASAAPFVATVNTLRDLVSRSEFIPEGSPAQSSEPTAPSAENDTSDFLTGPFGGSLDFA